jgi:hypothetical protein
LFPVFYLSLLLPDLFPEHFQSSSGLDPAAPRSLRPIIVAVLAAAITLALTPIAPVGVPVLVAAGAALLGLRAPRQPVPQAGDDA